MCSPRCAPCRRCSRPSRCGFERRCNGRQNWLCCGRPRVQIGPKDRTLSRPIVIHADWDPEAEVWVATTQDLRGLVTEAETVEALRAKLPGMILDLLEENGISDLPASIEIIARERSACRGGIAPHGGLLPRCGSPLETSRLRIQATRAWRPRNLVEFNKRHSRYSRSKAKVKIHGEWHSERSRAPEGLLNQVRRKLPNTTSSSPP
jgi:predicted RNase H-like HicB family nuclease